MNTIEIVCALIGAIATILGGVWYIVKQAFKSGINTQRLDVIEKNTNCLPCASHNSDLITIKSILIQKYPSSASIFSVKNSPRKLNTLGEMIYKEIDGEKFLCDNKKFFFEKIREQNPATALDVENAANLVCSIYTNESIFNTIKDYIYNRQSIKLSENGVEKTYDVTLSDISFILSIPLRDMFLVENKEF